MTEKTHDNELDALKADSESLRDEIAGLAAGQYLAAQMSPAAVSLPAFIRTIIFAGIAKWRTADPQRVYASVAVAGRAAVRSLGRDGISRGQCL